MYVCMYVCMYVSTVLPINQYNYSVSSYGEIVGQTEFFYLSMVTGLGEGKLWI